MRWRWARAEKFPGGNTLDMCAAQDEGSMLRSIMTVGGGITHYVVGSAYLIAHLVTFERRARGVKAI